ncbi:MAG: prenyltransferase/squalene oxidase repeat-containing protein [Isosphaeraceae bacterium]
MRKRSQSPRVLRIVRWRIRRFSSRLERHPPEWLNQLTPWMTSLSVHALILMLLGFGVLASTGDSKDGELVASLPTDQLIEDITALQPADQAGDPMANADTGDAPSLTLDPSQVDPNVTNLPELPPDFVLGKDLQMNNPGNTAEAAPTPAIGAAGPGGFQGMPGASGPKMAPFSGRSKDMRSAIVRREGGTVLSEQAVTRGLNWIVRHQGPDGNWSLNHRPFCKGAGCPSDAHMDSDTAATGLALLPLLGAGRIHTDPSDYSKNVKGGLDWLVKKQKPNGDLWTGGGGNTQMYSHAIATMALSEAYGVSKDEALKAPAQKAIDFIVKAQNPNDGGWRYSPGAPGDTCVFGWQMFALRSGALAGLEVPLESVEKCRKYLDRAKGDEYGSTYVYFADNNRNPSPVMSAEGLLCRQYLGWQRDFPPLLVGSERIFARLQDEIDFDKDTGAMVGLKSRNIYFWYYATQLLHNMQGPYWVQWNVQVRESLIATQNNLNGCAKGSWDPVLILADGRRLDDAWGRQAGRMFTTSLSLLTLEVYYRYLPLYQARDKHAMGGGKEK